MSHRIACCFAISLTDGHSSLAFYGGDWSLPDISGDESSRRLHRYDLPFPFYVEESVRGDSSYDV